MSRRSRPWPSFQKASSSLAIGRQGLNVKLANRLVDWSIDVKTEEQFAEMDLSRGAREAAHGLFRDEDTGGITNVAELEGISERLVGILAGAQHRAHRDLG